MRYSNIPVGDRKYQYTVLDIPVTGKQRYVVISDIHMGSRHSDYTEAWETLLREVGNPENHYNGVIINGDLTDFFAYQGDASSRQAHSEHIKSELRRLLTLPTQPTVTVVYGNHDSSWEFLRALNDLKREEPIGKRIFDCDALTMGDALFIHGDFQSHSPEKAELNPHEKRYKFSDIKPASYEHDRVVAADSNLKKFLNGTFSNARHIFFGHVHPDNPIHDYDYNGKTYHITGTSIVRYGNSVLSVEMENGAVKHVTPIYERKAQLDYDPYSKGHAAGERKRRNERLPASASLARSA